MSELLPCPCGAPVDLDECPYQSGPTMFKITCADHECSWSAIGRTPADAEHQWNRRAPVQDAKAVAWQVRVLAVKTGKIVDDWRATTKEAYDIAGGKSHEGTHFRCEYRILYDAPPSRAQVVDDAMPEQAKADS